MKENEIFTIPMQTFAILEKELDERINKEIEHLIGAQINNYDSYKYLLGKVHALKEFKKFTRKI